MKNLILCLFITLCFVACNNDDDSNDCDCNSATIETEQNLEGILYRNDSDSENVPDSNYVVLWTNAENPNWQTSYYVCNDYLVNQLGSIPDSGLDVNFSGKTKELCEQPISIPEHFYFRIELTQIETR